MQKGFRQNWKTVWVVFTVLFFFISFLFDYFDGEHVFTSHHLIQKAVSSIVSGFIFSMIMAAENPFRKKTKERAGI